MPPQPHQRFRSLRAFASNDVWAVAQTEVLHWDGKAWSNQRSDEDQVLEVVRGSGPKDLWVVGKDEGVPLVLHWDGTRWIEDFTAKFTGTMTDAWSDGQGTVWAVADGYPRSAEKQGAMLRRDRKGWVLVSVVSSPLRSVWGAGSGDVWAVGDEGAIEHWDGKAVTTVPNPSHATLRRVWGNGSRDVWFVGDSGTVLHWNGAAVAAIASGVDEPLHDVFGDASGKVWIAGGGSTLLQSNGTALGRRRVDLGTSSRCDGSASSDAPGTDLIAAAVIDGTLSRLVTATGAMLRLKEPPARPDGESGPSNRSDAAAVPP